MKTYYKLTTQTTALSNPRSYEPGIFTSVKNAKKEIARFDREDRKRNRIPQTWSIVKFYRPEVIMTRKEHPDMTARRAEIAAEDLAYRAKEKANRLRLEKREKAKAKLLASHGF